MVVPVRGKRGLIDADLARFYGVTTFNLNKTVARNPPFQLTPSGPDGARSSGRRTS